VKALVSRHNLAREAASAIGRRADRRAFVFRMAPAVLVLKDARRTGAVKVLLEP
jgi:hypothetical protein